MEELNGFYDSVPQLVHFLVAFGIMVCWIWVLIKIFQDNHVGLGIFCIVTTFIFGFGLLITFVYGWAKHHDLGTTNVMIVWSVPMGVWLLPAFLFSVYE